MFPENKRLLLSPYGNLTRLSCPFLITDHIESDQKQRNHALLPTCLIMNSRIHDASVGTIPKHN